MRFKTLAAGRHRQLMAEVIVNQPLAEIHLSSSRPSKSFDESQSSPISSFAGLRRARGVIDFTAQTHGLVGFGSPAAKAPPHRQGQSDHGR